MGSNSGSLSLYAGRNPSARRMNEMILFILVLLLLLAHVSFPQVVKAFSYTTKHKTEQGKPHGQFQPVHLNVNHRFPSHLRTEGTLTVVVQPRVRVHLS